jgi:hypothetical protein
MGWRIGAAALGVLALGLAAIALDQRRRLAIRLPRRDIDRWEEEGGAPASPGPGVGHGQADTAPTGAS